MNLRTDFTMILTILLGVVVTLSASAQNDALQLASRAGEEDFKCSVTGSTYSGSPPHNGTSILSSSEPHPLVRSGRRYPLCVRLFATAS